MRYLKKFESSVEFYTKIGDLWSSVEDRDLRPFAKNEYDEVKNHIPDRFTFGLDFGDSEYSFIWMCSNQETKDRRIGRHIYIYKGDDEWFYLCVPILKGRAYKNFFPISRNTRLTAL